MGLLGVWLVVGRVVFLQIFVCSLICAIRLPVCRDVPRSSESFAMVVVDDLPEVAKEQPQALFKDY